MHGNEVRLIADAKLSDSVKVQKEEQLTRQKNDERKINESLDLLRQDYQSSRGKTRVSYVRAISASGSSIFTCLKGPSFRWRCFILKEMLRCI
ncbi:sporulation peptidase YabG [Bacillus sp. SL00103]